MGKTIGYIFESVSNYEILHKVKMKMPGKGLRWKRNRWNAVL